MFSVEREKATVLLTIGSGTLIFIYPSLNFFEQIIFLFYLRFVSIVAIVMPKSINGKIRQ